MKNILFSIILMFSLVNADLLGQTTISGTSRKNFSKDYLKLITGSNSKEVGDFLKKEFDPMLSNGNEFSDYRFQAMVETIDLLIENKHPAYPHTYNYLLSVYALTKGNKSQEEFDLWHKILNELSAIRNPKRIRDFLSFSGDFLYSKKIANDPNFEWYITSDDYKFINDKDGILLEIGNTTLVCRTINRGRSKREDPYSDSIKIENTTGIFELSKERWKGTKGKITWEKVGLPENETFATLNEYTISLKSTHLNADSVELRTPYINEPVLGKLMDRAVKGAATSEEGEGQYPQFYSYKADYKIDNLVHDIDYQGGFSLEGNEFVGMGNKDAKAKLTYYKDLQPFVYTFSDQVRVNRTTITTPMARFSMILESGDSITHTGLNISYNIKDKSIHFVRGDSPMQQAPFVDYYHKMNIYVEEISWIKDTKELILAFNPIKSAEKRTAKFESFNYFDDNLYQSLQGAQSLNPLSALYQYAYKYDRFEMGEGTAATALNSTLQQCKPSLLKLATLGFIIYDTEKGIINLTPKIEHFVLAKSGKADYDNIAFSSDLTPILIDDNQDNQKMSPEEKERLIKKAQNRRMLKSFGKIDLSTLDLALDGVDFIPISDLNQTAIFPEENNVVIKYNRDMIFNGWVNSGKWEIKVEDGDYSYKENTINIFESDIALFEVNPLRAEDGKRRIPLQSSINGIKGKLVVDDTTNRSGLNKKEFGNYPLLVSKEKSKVFYNQKDLHKGAYEKERFYFELEPFEIDSLVNFNEKATRFKGELVSAGIFPVIKEDLKVMPDYSLGFSRSAPEDGYEFYGTEANYNNKILLSNNGLQGAGTIDFITSTSTSLKLFTFLPDSTIGVVAFENRPQETGVEFPDVTGDGAFLTFIPKKKTLKARSLDQPLKFFNKEANLNGELTLRENGMRARGVAELPNASFQAANMKFKRWYVDADTSNFVIKNKYQEDANEDPLAIKSENMKGHLDFKERMGVFKSNEGESTVEFPVNQYICKIDQFTWMMDNDELTLEKNDVYSNDDDGSIDLAGSNFISTHPKQDSLRFGSPKAKFDLKEKVIHAYGTEYIDVADARIYPDSGLIVVRKNAAMDELFNAKIVANYITKYHSIIDVSAKITARRAYTASGNYEYGIGEDKEYIKLKQIVLDEAFQTVAKGIVEIGDSFMLSEQFNFYGGVELKASNPFLTFDGATRITHNCKSFARNWMAFKSPIDPENIRIPVAENMTDIEGNKLSAGIQWLVSEVTDSVKLYPTFLSMMRTQNDTKVISASGLLQFNNETREYQIASENKLINQNETGNYVALNTETCSLTGDGIINLGMDFGTLTVDAVGTVKYNQSDDQTDMNLTLAIRAPMDEKAFKDVGGRMSDMIDLLNGDFNNNTLERALVEWTDRETADKFKSDFLLKGEIKSMPRVLRDAIVLTGIHLTSHTVSGDPQRGLKSSLNSGIIVNMFSAPVMKYTAARLFAEERPTIGGRLGLLLEIEGEIEYFFDYDNRKTGILNILSNDIAFNMDISSLKADKKKERRFAYDITNDSASKAVFLRAFSK